MAAPQVPPHPTRDYVFLYVMEFPGRLNPAISKVFAAYNEPLRHTRDILLNGKRRPLLFLSERTSRDAAWRRHWRDVTKQFNAEYELVGEGVAAEWRPRNPLAPLPITAPDARATIPPEAKREDPLALSVKDLLKLLPSGKLDEQLEELMAREVKGDNEHGAARQGVIAALAQRIGTHGKRPEQGATPAAG